MKRAMNVNQGTNQIRNSSTTTWLKGFSLVFGMAMLAGPALAFTLNDETSIGNQETRVETTHVISTEGIAYCGQQDLEAACRPMFYRTDDGQIFRIVNSPLLVAELGDGKENLRVTLTGDVVLSTLFSADRLHVTEFTVLQHLKGGVRDVAGKVAPILPEDSSMGRDRG